MLASSLPEERHRRVHILANVTSLSITPTSVGSDVLEEHHVRDRDRIPYASIHYPLLICKHFSRQIMYTFGFFMRFLCLLCTLCARTSLDHCEKIIGKEDQRNNASIFIHD